MKPIAIALWFATSIAAAQSPPPAAPPPPHKHKHGAIWKTDPLADVLAAVANETMIFEINRKDLGSSSMAPDAGKRALADAQICSDAVKLATTDTVQVGATTVRIADADAAYCAPLAAIARTFDADRAAAKTAATAKLLAPFKAAGITGDKLQLAYRDTQFYGAGGGALTVAQLKTANVVFELEGGGQTPWSLTRYEYRGDKLVRSTAQHYRVRPGASKFH